MKLARETSSKAQNELLFSQLFIPSIYLLFSFVEQYTCAQFYIFSCHSCDWNKFCHSFPFRVPKMKSNWCSLYSQITVEVKKYGLRLVWTRWAINQRYWPIWVIKIPPSFVSMESFRARVQRLCILQCFREFLTFFTKIPSNQDIS